MRSASMTALLLFAGSAALAESIYTDADKSCVDERDEHGVMSRCPGPAGYAIIFTDEGNVVDARFGLRGRERNLGGLQWLGGIGAKKVEWRMANGKPIAAIFRVSTMNPETSAVTDRLAVVKITPQGGCLIELVDARDARANEKARLIADERAVAVTCGK